MDYMYVLADAASRRTIASVTTKRGRQHAIRLLEAQLDVDLSHQGNGVSVGLRALPIPCEARWSDLGVLMVMRLKGA